MRTVQVQYNQPCKFSEEGRITMSTSSKLLCTGLIVGETQDEQCYKVLWPNSKTPIAYHKSFIEIISENVDEEKQS